MIHLYMKKQFQMSHEDDVAFGGQTVMSTGKHIHNAQGDMPLPPLVGTLCITIHYIKIWAT